jgi:hypothetical protein
MTRILRTIATASVLVLGYGNMAAAQAPNPSTNPEAMPRLDLSPAQKQTIFTSITNLNLKNNTPENFQPIVGAVVPPGVDFEPMPKTISELVPQTRDFQVAMIGNQVAIVEPKSRRVVEAIVGEKR